MWWTLSRPSEVAEAEWSEFDLDNALWTIPAERMKARREHIVPLPTQAITILRSLYGFTGNRKHLFPDRDSCHKPMSTNSLRQFLKTRGWSGIYSPHTIRTTGSTRLNELGYRPDAIEAQLAHMDSNSVRRSYNHATYLEECKIMILPLDTQSLEYRCLIQAIVWQRIVVWVEEIEVEGGTTNILKSVSPFEYLIDTHSDDIYRDTLRNNASSYRFLATLRPETPLDVLRQHGRISYQPCRKLPCISQEEWQGLWVPNEDGWESLYEKNIHQPKGIGEWHDLPHKSMKPLVHGLQEDGGDYLRYLIYWKSQCQ